MRITEDSYSAVAEVCIPNTTLESLSYGVNEDVKKGSVVWVSLKGRKKPLLALVLNVHENFPKFKLKALTLHESGYAFSQRYIEMLFWCASYYMCSLGEALTAFWPAELEKYLLVDGTGQRIAGEKEQLQGAAPALTLEQKNALDILTELLPHSPKFRGALLHGVTGSGKTRVYLELAKKAMEAGLKTLILVPEINLTPQTQKRFEEYLACEIPILHSALGAKQKRETWKGLLNASPAILLGTRSAILAPFEPQLIIIDEEHDSSYKQQDPAPRYNVRETAFHIAHKYGALVILGSATPSVETYKNAKEGNLKLIEMKVRPGGLPLPKIIIADMKEQRKKQDKDLMLSPILRDTLSKTISEGNQAIILMNRRGHSTNRICEDCGEPMQCSDCSVALVYHKQYGNLMCHYCGRLYPPSMPCECGSQKVAFLGSGIEKAEEEIKEWLPAAKLLRLDADTTSRLGATEKLLGKFRNGEANILLGTQMVAKGHDFPRVSLVGVLYADIGSFAPDFRAGEKYFQLLTQVAGRAGRFLENSSVIIQTFCPENPVMQFAIKHDYLGFSGWELAERQEAFYPPFCKIAQIKMQARDKKKLEEAANILARILSNGFSGNGTCLGPAEPPIYKVQKNHRMVITIKTINSADLKNAIKNSLASPIFAKVSKGIDVRIDRDA
ncbi:MAG: primosomal protein N' [Fibromonadaceae bacterium]|jgi:primosomal protein N' (replication factor Y)|nr:primosomal protein N' [Fibromonadaceae bacterium]